MTWIDFFLNIFFCFCWWCESEKVKTDPNILKTTRQNIFLSLCLSPSLPFSFSFPKDVTVKKKSDNIYMRRRWRIFFRYIWWKWNKSDQVFIFLPQKNTEQFFLLLLLSFWPPPSSEKKSHHLFTSFVFTSCFFLMCWSHISYVS